MAKPIIISAAAALARDAEVIKVHAKIDAKLAKQSTETLLEMFSLLRAKHDEDSFLVLGRVGDELLKRLGDNAFDELLDACELRESANKAA